ncbi:hypothetical protein BgiMline_023585 [Biomphalaria glabrata]|nr:hypothetical protein BgiMline_006822 [Biomphalaria glabrata]
MFCGLTSLNSLHRNTFLILSNAVEASGEEAGDKGFNKAADIIEIFKFRQIVCIISSDVRSTLVGLTGLSLPDYREALFYQTTERRYSTRLQRGVILPDYREALFYQTTERRYSTRLQRGVILPDYREALFYQTTERRFSTRLQRGVILPDYREAFFYQTTERRYVVGLYLVM